MLWKKCLEDLIKISKEKYIFKLLKFKQEKFSGISILKAIPKLPPKQLNAIQLAINENYYTFPRKIDLDKLAKISKTKKATYRENLRKAENKLIPRIL
mgnify:CR=1 FL=1